VSEPRAVYQTVMEVTDEERRMILRLRQVKGAMVTIDTDAMTLHVATRTEYLAPRHAVGTQAFSLQVLDT
jgi:hypothetical protein